MRHRQPESWLQAPSLKFRQRTEAAPNDHYARRQLLVDLDP